MASLTGAGNPLAIHLPSLDDTYGAVLLGTFFGLMYVLYSTVPLANRTDLARTSLRCSLYGLSVHQGYQYLRIHWADLRSLKIYMRVASSVRRPARRLTARAPG